MQGTEMIVRDETSVQPATYGAFYDQFARSIREGEPLPVKPEDARDVIRLIELCLESNKQRKWIAF